MNFSKSHASSLSQSGSALVMILITVALFAALSFAISQQSDSTKGLTTEKVRLLATDVMDMGNKLSESVAQLRLRGVKIDQISFENNVVSGYNNAACTVDKCKIFANDGGGRDWEIPPSEINGSLNWIFTGDLAIQDMGGTGADLVAILPKVSLDLCNYINKMLGITTLAGPPPSFASVSANQFAGTYAVAPYAISNSVIKGQKSGCINLTSSSGTAFTPITGPAYAFYQVLEAR